MKDNPKYDSSPYGLGTGDTSEKPGGDLVSQFIKMCEVAEARNEMHQDTARGHVARIRELVREGRIEEAEGYAERTPTKVGFYDKG